MFPLAQSDSSTFIGASGHPSNACIHFICIFFLFLSKVDFANAGLCLIFILFYIIRSILVHCVYGCSGPYWKTMDNAWSDIYYLKSWAKHFNTSKKSKGHTWFNNFLKWSHHVSIFSKQISQRRTICLMLPALLQTLEAKYFHTKATAATKWFVYPEKFCDGKMTQNKQLNNGIEIWTMNPKTWHGPICGYLLFITSKLVNH